MSNMSNENCVYLSLDDSYYPITIPNLENATCKDLWREIEKFIKNDNLDTKNSPVFTHKESIKDNYWITFFGNIVEPTDIRLKDLSMLGGSNLVLHSKCKIGTLKTLIVHTLFGRKYTVNILDTARIGDLAACIHDQNPKFKPEMGEFYSVTNEYLNRDKKIYLYDFQNNDKVKVVIRLSNIFKIWRY